MLSCHHDIVISSMLKLLYKNPVNKNQAVVKIVTDAIRGCAKGYHLKVSRNRGMLWCQIECTPAAQLRGRAEQLDRAGSGGRGRRLMCSGLILFRSANFCAKPGIGTRIADTVIFKIENELHSSCVQSIFPVKDCFFEYPISPASPKCDLTYYYLNMSMIF